LQNCFTAECKLANEGCQPSNTFFIKQYDKISDIPFHTFCQDKFQTDKHPCALKEDFRAGFWIFPNTPLLLTAKRKNNLPVFTDKQNMIRALEAVEMFFCKNNLAVFSQKNKKCFRI